MGYATVRIASREQWEEWHPGRKLSPGDEVEIETTSCAIDPPTLNLEGHPSGNRWWMVSDATMDKFASDPRRRWICEHMLEMD
jgi:hypothetical protein